MNNRGLASFASVVPMLLFLVSGLVILSMGSAVQQQLADENCGNLTSPGVCQPDGFTLGYNATNNSLGMYQNMNNLMPVVGIVMGAALVMGGLAFFTNRF